MKKITLLKTKKFIMKQETVMELDGLSTNAQEQENSSQSGKIIDIEKVLNTPFEIVKSERGCFIAIGNNRLTEMSNEEELKESIEAKDWTLLIQTMVHITNKVVEALRAEDRARNENL